MRRRNGYLSILVAVFLSVGTIAPCVVESRALNSETVIVRNLHATADGAEQTSKPKGNGFVRAISAPFRALGRLFGGGKKKKNAEKAKKQEPKIETTVKSEAAQTPGAAGATIEARAAEQPKKAERPKKESKKKTESAQATAVVVAPSQPVAPAQMDAPAPARQSESVRMVRPAEGQAAQSIPKTPPKWIPVIEGIGRDPLTQGRALLQHGYLSEAIAELSIAATVGPDLVEANNLLGLAYDRTGAHDLAIEAYERALSASPDNPQVLNNLGYSLFLADRYADALKRLKQAERLSPGAPFIIQNIALTQARMGKYDDAFKSFKRAFGEYDARLKTAELLEQANRLDDAIKHYNAALKLQPNSPTLLERLAQLYDRTGRTREAEATRRTLSQPNKQKTATGGGG